MGAGYVPVLNGQDALAVPLVSQDQAGKLFQINSVRGLFRYI